MIDKVVADRLLKMEPLYFADRTQIKEPGWSLSSLPAYTYPDNTVDVVNANWNF